MYILISIFAFSFLGMVSLVGYKLVALEKRTVVLGIPEHQHSLEHRVGALTRTLTKRYTEKIVSWIQTVCVPALVGLLQQIVILIVRGIKYIGTRLSHREHPLDATNIPRTGASSFFLKDITEHKKNLKNNEH